MTRITTATQLQNNGQPWPDGTILDLQPGSKWDVAQPIRGAGKLAVIGNGCTLRNVRPVYVGTKAPGLATFESSTELNIDNLTLEQLTSDGPQGWKGNRAIEITGGKFTLDNIELANGDGIFVRRCQSGQIVGGGVSKSMYSYNVYLGSYQDGPADVAHEVTINGFEFRNGRKETGLRVMGADNLSIQACSFTHDDLDARPDNDKEVIQLRVVRDAMVRGCTFTGSVETGELKYDIDNGLHWRMADLWGRSDVTFADCNIAGYLNAAGLVDVTLINTTPTGKDPRNIGDGKPLSRKTYSYNGRTHEPTITTKAATNPTPQPIPQPPPPVTPPQSLEVSVPAGVKRIVLTIG